MEDVWQKLYNLEFRGTRKEANDRWEMYDTKIPIQDSEGHIMMQMKDGRCMTQTFQFRIQRDKKISK